MTSHDSYPLNSANASPPGTFTVYLSCATTATTLVPASHSVATPMAIMLFRFIAVLPLNKLLLDQRQGGLPLLDDVGGQLARGTGAGVLRGMDRPGRDEQHVAGCRHDGLAGNLVLPDPGEDIDDFLAR